MSGLQELDVIIIGAGAAGLAALADLDRAGLRVLCLEARDRIGGRILTVHDAASPIPIELGAEFIHGRPPETWKIVESAGLAAYDCTENAAHIEAAATVHNADAWLPVDEIMSDMQRVAGQTPDQTFASFLAATNYPESAKKIATSYVEGFNAAYADRIGIASLSLDSQASEAIDGDRSFRVLPGYDAVPRWLLNQTANPAASLRLNAIVEKVQWRSKSVTVTTRSGLTGEKETYRAARLIVTVPLGVLQAEPGQVGSIHFDPLPGEAIAAAKTLCFGQVFRTVLRFRQRIWESNQALADTGFLLSDEPAFPTWWTPLPFRAPLITGWSSGRKAAPLLGQSSQAIIRSSIERLARIASLDPNALHSSLQAAYFHDWASDPFARGAYSYVPVGGLPARQLLATPVDETLYFSGEATETNGHGATVHGAIASGRRAAREILRS